MEINYREKPERLLTDLNAFTCIAFSGDAPYESKCVVCGVNNFGQPLYRCSICGQPLCGYLCADRHSNKCK